MSVTVELEPLVEPAVELAETWALATAAGETAREKATAGQLAQLVADPAGLALAVRFVDRVARPEDIKVAARELSGLGVREANFLGRVDRSLLGAGALAARVSPQVVVPAARRRLRQLVGHLVVDADDAALTKHLEQARSEGFRLNINLLGEAVLGEKEAASRTQRTQALLERDDVDYVSIKVSSLVSQIVTWDLEGTVARCLDRLRPLYRAAMVASPHKFVNLDMEEYRDLDLTLAVFEAMLSEPEFKDISAGVVLQAYLPDAMPALERVIDFSARRVAEGGAPLKVRLVKGANLAMEAVDAELHGWEQAPYPSKEETDANYIRCLERVLRPEVSSSLRVGVASHNLYDLALAHLLATTRDITEMMDVEMLQGMSPSQARAVRDTVGEVILYTPVVAPKDFDVAVSYLVRRLEENAAPQNFVHAFFSNSPTQMDDQERRFRASVANADRASVGPRRPSGPAEIGDAFANTPDTDPALPPNREMGLDALATPAREARSPWLASTAEVDAVIETATQAGKGWAARPATERAQLLREAARQLQARRPLLLSVMSHEAGKTLVEADPEISEAVDFARYYAESALQLGQGLAADGAQFLPDRVVLVTPPWNFPVAIPIGGCLAALAAGAAVVVKPAPQTPVCLETAVEALWAAGVPREVLQVVRTDEDEVGQHLVSHRDVDTVLLTGATRTAEVFAGWRGEHPRGPRVFGETSGKNALVVTPAADLDLAVADLVKSAFGHAGQKCSAASLAILVGSIATSERFRNQLVDAVSSLVVDWPTTNAGTVMGPLIEAPGDKLHRALTQLDVGEEWLVEPRQLDDEGRLWSPGVKTGVAPGSYFHTTEVFGPVLGLMTAKDLATATGLQNATGYGLTGGLHSLDEKEIAWWLDHVEVGNAYVNRQITGAIVQRQSFGGWKRSSVGPGAKAGGPNYVAQLGAWKANGIPQFRGSSTPEVQRAVDRAQADLGLELSADDRAWVRVAAESDAAAIGTEFGAEHDRSGLRSELNVFRYRPLDRLGVRLQTGARAADLVRLVAAAAVTEVRLEVSADPTVNLPEQVAGHPVTTESAAGFNERMEREDDLRVRVVGNPGSLRVTNPGVALLTGPVLATGGRELLAFVHEQAISRTTHRYGHAQVDPSV
ncbi:bifunctional proline dehydrogenase/L-glutamate gamma-semialdehyde dehydrogenase [Luteococcus sanguinis]|uniref:L-glutamate gamma-semialdehyde dehydrogenase n=1 Tax=Luteococcus sanguinis TaxID=174038 RepID=A0ABW1X194_9ACTN